jgi:hypothetical protein
MRLYLWANDSLLGLIVAFCVTAFDSVRYVIGIQQKKNGCVINHNKTHDQSNKPQTTVTLTHRQ